MYSYIANYNIQWTLVKVNYRGPPKNIVLANRSFTITEAGLIIFLCVYNNTEIHAS